MGRLTEYFYYLNTPRLDTRYIAENFLWYQPTLADAQLRSQILKEKQERKKIRFERRDLFAV